MSQRLRLLATIVIPLFMTACGQPQLGSSEEGYRVVMRLNVAVMSKRADLLPPILESAASLRDSEMIPMSAYTSIARIADAGLEGDWPRAQEQCLAFQKGQRTPIDKR